MRDKLRLVKPEPVVSRQPSAEHIKQIFAQRLFDFASPLYLVDKTGHLTWCNLPYRQLGEKLALRDGIIELLPMAALLAESAGQDRVIRRDVAVSLDGQNQALRVHHVQLTGKDGEQSGLAGLVEPIDNSAQLAADLALAQERFDDVVRLTSDWVWKSTAR